MTKVNSDRYIKFLQQLVVCETESTLSTDGNICLKKFLKSLHNSA